MRSIVPRQRCYEARQKREDKGALAGAHSTRSAPERSPASLKRRHYSAIPPAKGDWRLLYVWREVARRPTAPNRLEVDRVCGREDVEAESARSRSEHRLRLVGVAAEDGGNGPLLVRLIGAWPRRHLQSRERARAGIRVASVMLLRFSVYVAHHVKTAPARAAEV